MIVSHRHRFIFIKTQKTAGTAMEVALSSVCGPDDIITPIQTWIEGEREEHSGRGPQNWRLDHPRVPKRALWKRLLRRPERHYHPTVGYYDHMPAWRVQAYLGDDIWQSYFKFAFERNPFDRQVSWYHYKTKSKPADRKPTFEAFLADKRRARVDNRELYTIDGVLAVDFLGRYERLGEDFREALRRAGLPEDLSLPRVNVRADSAIKGNSDAHKSPEPGYRRYYSAQTRETVSAWYADEISELGYAY